MIDQAQRLREMMGGDSTQGSSPGATIISITSGKGGVGKTSFTVNFAIALANLGKRVIVVDADFGFANIDVLLGTKTKYDLSHVIRGEMSISDVMAVGHGGIKFISGGAGLTELMTLNTKKLGIILSELLKLDKMADYIIFDTGAGANEKILSVIGASDEILLVCTPEPTSIMDAFVMTKTIKSISRAPNIKVVINKAESHTEAVSTMNSFKRVVEKHLSLELYSMGYIMNDENMVKSIKQQMPLVLNFPDAISAKNIMDIAKKYSGVDITVKPKGINGFLEKLQKKLSR